ncbi:MAG: periplasmic heavy metal sensor [Nitrospiraceae bacterium]
MIPIRIMTLGVAAGLLVFTVGAGPAWADGGRGCGGGHFLGMGHGTHGHGGTAHRLNRLLQHKQDLGLTDEQVTKLKGLSLDQDRARIKAHADVMVAARELRSLVSDEKAELSVIEAKVNEQEALEAKLRMIGIKGKRDLYAVLTPEQRNKYKTFREQLRHGYGSRMMKADAGDGIGDQGQVGVSGPLQSKPDMPNDGAPSS